MTPDLIYKTGLWLTAEIWFNFIGLDYLADYSEFVFTQYSGLSFYEPKQVQVTDYPLYFCPQIDDFCTLIHTSSQCQHQ